jgi:MoxR-like ATPase
MAGAELPQVEAVCDPAVILASRALVSQIYLDDRVKRYILNLVFATRFPEARGLKALAPFIQVGVSPRGRLGLAWASKAHAFVRQRISSMKQYYC